MQTSSLHQALCAALDDEFRARATYRKVLERWGPVRPFVNIVEAEERHIQALLPLFQRYGLPVPPDPWPERVEVPETLAEACRMGVEAEIENAALYDRLLAMTSGHPDVRYVLRRLQRASRDHHLPAFQRCVQRTRHQGPGRTGRGGCP